MGSFKDLKTSVIKIVTAIGIATAVILEAIPGLGFFGWGDGTGIVSRVIVLR